MGRQRTILHGMKEIKQTAIGNIIFFGTSAEVYSNSMAITTTAFTSVLIRNLYFLRNYGMFNVYIYLALFPFSNG